MSAKIIIMGRPTRDPEIERSQNGTEYVSLDLAVSQRGQNGKDETVFYQCYFNKSLADRLGKAQVRKGSCLVITGTLELHAFVYQQGNRAGTAGISANVRVLDWEYAIANRPENGGNTQPPANGQNNYGTPGNGQSYPQGNAGGSQAAPNTSGYQSKARPNNGYPQQNAQNQGGTQNYQTNGYPAQPPAGGYPQGNYGGFQNVQQEQLPFPN